MRRTLIAVAVLVFLGACRGDPPRIVLFAANPAEIVAGMHVILRWEVEGAANVAISRDQETLLSESSASGEIELAPTETATYTLTARSGGGVTARASVTVTVRPGAAVLTFAANPRQVRPGESTTLSWTTAGAAAVALTANGNALTIDQSLVNGQVSVAPTTTSTYVLTAQSPAGDDSRSLVVPYLALPVIRSFTADKPLSDAATDVVLAWNVFNPEPSQPDPTLSMKDDLGNKVSVSRKALVDSITLRPERSTTYTLTATSEGGDVSATVTVTVNPNILTFTATPSAVAPGDTVTLKWTSAGATSLTLTEGVRTLATITDPLAIATGTFADAVPSSATAPLAYTLAAVPTQLPCNYCTRAADVAVGPKPVIARFAAEPPAVLSGGRPNLVFQISGATQARIRIGTTTLTTITSATRLANGSYLAPAITAATVYELVAQSAIGVAASASVTVPVAPPAQVGTFTATPTTVANGGDPVTLAWTTANATEVVVEEASGVFLFGSTSSATVASGSTLVKPATAATFRLRAFGAARDVATATVAVAVTAPLSFTASLNPAVAGERPTLAWDLSGAGVADVTLTPPPYTQPTNAFDDIAATGSALSFSGTDDGLATLAFPAGFTFPFAGRQRTAATVSTNGWLGLASAYAASAPDNGAVPAASEPGEFVAPFWDDLKLGTTGKVVWQLNGTAPSRWMVVQWEGVQISGLTSSALTFEVLLFETGVVDFRYKTLSASTAARAQGSSATVGLELSASRGSAFSVNSASLAPGMTISFPLSGGLAANATGTVASYATQEYTLFGLSGGTPVVASLHHQVLRPGDVAITEVMVDPPAGVGTPAGEWIEIANRTAEPVSLSGMVLSAGVATHTIGGLVIPPSGRRVLGGSTDVAQNGGAPVDYAYSGVTLDNTSQTINLALRTSTVAALTYNTAQGFPVAQGVALVRDDRLATLATAPAALGFCQAIGSYGTAGGKGTPGTPNDACFYAATRSTSFVDVSASGTVLAGKNPNNTFTVALPFTFTYFGQAFTQVFVSDNGWLSFGAMPTSSHPTNARLPSTSDPDGVIAAFWDSLSTSKDASSPPARIVVATIDPDGNPGTPNSVFVVQWQSYDFPGTTNVDADLNFEVKLHEGGDIEIQWGSMSAGDAGDARATGQNATAGIENPTGYGAIELFFDTIGAVAPSSGWLFTKR